MHVLVCDSCGRTKGKDPVRRGVQRPGYHVGWWINCSLQLGGDALFSAKDLCSPCRTALLRVLKETLTEYWKGAQKVNPGVCNQTPSAGALAPREGIIEGCATGAKVGIT